MKSDCENEKVIKFLESKNKFCPFCKSGKLILKERLAQITLVDHRFCYETAVVICDDCSHLFLFHNDYLKQSSNAFKEISPKRHSFFDRKKT